MKVAIAGAGNVAKYLVEELRQYGHDVIILTRSKKPALKDIEQRETDYSIESLVSVLHDREAIVSTVRDHIDPLATVEAHLNLLEACKRSTSCKTFIPSEWTLNVEDYPEQPMLSAESSMIMIKKLKEAKGIRWTIFCNAWLCDYVLPQERRNLAEIGPAWPMDHASKTFTIYGPGTQSVSFTSTRDLARAVAALLDSKEPWEPYICVSGDKLTWNELYALVKKFDSTWTSNNKPLAETVRQYAANESPISQFVADFELLSYSGAMTFPAERVQQHRAKYFPNVKFRSVKEVLEAAAASSSGIV